MCWLNDQHASTNIPGAPRAQSIRLKNFAIF